MKKVIIILTFIIMFLNCAMAAQNKIVTKDYKVVTKDNFAMTATLKYPKIQDKNIFSTVVLLHSIGYNSQWWETLPDELLKEGYAVLLIDLRGHGQSIYNSKLVRQSWNSMTDKAYAKYPDDVVTVINYVKNENKRVFFRDWAIVGSDIGASAGIIAANKLPYKPKTIVVLSPVVLAKGIYVPINLAELDKNIDILNIISKRDNHSLASYNYLKKFAQSTFAEYISDSNSHGMLMLKNDETLTKVITSWIKEYLH